MGKALQYQQCRQVMREIAPNFSVAGVCETRIPCRRVCQPQNNTLKGAHVGDLKPLSQRFFGFGMQNAYISMKRRTNHVE